MLAEARAVPYDLSEEEGFQPNIEKLKELITPRTKGLVVNSPSNPTGSVLSRNTFRALVDLAKDHELWVISDEVYEDFIYEGEHFSFCTELEMSVVLNSFSKSFAVPGWRLGFMTSPTSIVDQICQDAIPSGGMPPGSAAICDLEDIRSPGCFHKKGASRIRCAQKKNDQDAERYRWLHLPSSKGCVLRLPQVRAEHTIEGPPRKRSWRTGSYVHLVRPLERAGKVISGSPMLHLRMR